MIEIRNKNTSKSLLPLMKSSLVDSSLNQMNDYNKTKLSVMRIIHMKYCERI